VDGNVTINNGHGNAAGMAGFVNIFNQFNTPFRSIIGGNLTVTYLDGNAATFDGLWDTEVLGNVTLNHGSGTFATYMDGYNTRLPVLIHGSLAITGTGANSVAFGTADIFGKGSGLVVGRNFTLTSGGGAAETLSFKNFEVGGITSIKLGNGGNTVTIDDSYFGGTFTLLSGAGADTVHLETTAGTTSATEFKKAVHVDLGGQVTDIMDFVAIGSETPDDDQVLFFWGPVTLGVWGGTIYGDNIYFPNGGHLL